MKKALTLLLAITMVCLLVAPVAGVAEEKVRLTVLAVPHSLTKDLNEIPYFKEMADKAGVELVFDIVPGGPGYVERKSAMLASGELPDILLGTDALTKADIAQFSDLLADMSQLLDCAPNVKKMFEEKPEIESMVTDEEGQIFALLKYQRFWPRNMTRQMINQAWLDKLGLSAPTTWEELYDILMAFKTQDPNGNGQADEIPMDWAPGISGFHVTSMIAGMGLPISMYQGQGYYVEDGVVKNFFISPEYKQLIQFLDKCYADGLINKDVYTQDYSTFQSLGRGGNVGFTFGWDAADRMGPDYSKDFVYLPPLKPTADYVGEQYWENDFYLMNYAYPAVSISDACKNKEKAMAFVDLFFDPYYAMQALFGSVGECIQDNGDGSYSVLPPADTTMDPGTWKWVNAMADASPMYIADSLQLSLPEDMQLMATMDQVYDEYLSKFEMDDLWPGPFMKTTADESVELSQLNLDIFNIVTNKQATWITAGGVDNEWDEYLATVKQAGIERAIEIYQDIENRFLGK